MHAFDPAALEGKYGIVLAERQDAIWTMPAAELATRRGAEQLISVYAPMIKALEPAVAAAYFSGRFGGVARALQYAMSRWNLGLELPLDRMTVQLSVQDGYGMFCFVLRELRTSAAPTANRESWRRSLLTDFVDKTARPVLEALASAAGINAGQLWGQMATGLYYYKEEWLAGAEDEESKSRIRQDFAYLTEELAPSVFGRKKNPFDVNIRWIEDWQQPGKYMRQKVACCLYCRTEGGTYCYTCPRMDDKQRSERREKLLAQARG